MGRKLIPKCGKRGKWTSFEAFLWRNLEENSSKKRENAKSGLVLRCYCGETRGKTHPIIKKIRIWLKSSAESP